MSKNLFDQVHARSVALPPSQSSEDRTPLYHIIDLHNIPSGLGRRKVTAEWVIALCGYSGENDGCRIFYTSYIIVAKKGLLAPPEVDVTGTYGSWDQFASPGPAESYMNIVPRDDGVLFDIYKGVSKGGGKRAQIGEAFVHSWAISEGVPEDSAIYTLLVVSKRAPPFTCSSARVNFHGVSRVSTDLSTCPPP